MTRTVPSTERGAVFAGRCALMSTTCSLGTGEAELAVVTRDEALAAEVEGAGDVQDVEATAEQLRRVAIGKLARTGEEGAVVQGDAQQPAGGGVLLEVAGEQSRRALVDQPPAVEHVRRVADLQLV